MPTMMLLLGACVELAQNAQVKSLASVIGGMIVLPALTRWPVPVNWITFPRVASLTMVGLPVTVAAEPPGATFAVCALAMESSGQ